MCYSFHFCLLTTFKLLSTVVKLVSCNFVVRTCRSVGRAGTIGRSLIVGRRVVCSFEEVKSRALNEGWVCSGGVSEEEEVEGGKW